MSYVLEINSLKKSFKTGFWRRQVEVLHDISFQIQQGKISGFIGSNGAGKTTTIKCMLQLIFPEAGEIRFFGRPGYDLDIRKRIGFLPERPYFYDYLTGAEFLRFYGQLSRIPSGKQLENRIDELLELVRLKAAKNKTLKDFSKGMLQRIGIAQALIHKPEFVILDEPMSGLDPDGRSLVRQIIVDTASVGTSVFFSSHLLFDTEKLCEDIVVLSRGKTVYCGGTKELLNTLNAGFRLVYADGENKITKNYESNDQLQMAIAEMASQKKQIIEVTRERASLEQVYMNIAQDENTQQVDS
jgi:ABC-2 type transport system ATP-binding protein